MLSYILIANTSNVDIFRHHMIRITIYPPPKKKLEEHAYAPISAS